MKPRYFWPAIIIPAALLAGLANNSTARSPADVDPYDQSGVALEKEPTDPSARARSSSSPEAAATARANMSFLPGARCS